MVYSDAYAETELVLELATSICTAYEAAVRDAIATPGLGEVRK